MECIFHIACSWDERYHNCILSAMLYSMELEPFMKTIRFALPVLLRMVIATSMLRYAALLSTICKNLGSKAEIPTDKCIIANRCMIHLGSQKFSWAIMHIQIDIHLWDTAKNREWPFCRAIVLTRYWMTFLLELRVHLFYFVARDGSHFNTSIHYE